MYKINKKDNTIEPVPEKTFSELKYKEVSNLQEWIAKKPSCLGEELLIIQKEFQGFDDTNERLDLLAIDKKGNIVIIENKLDDSGKDVIWQALKYAAYCSTLTKIQIIDIYSKYLRKDISVAEEKLAEFLEKESLEGVNLNDKDSQRIFLVAAKFRKEVTSTVLWLSNYSLPLKCFRVTPYSQGTEDYVSFDQIIPLKDAEEYIIRMAEKKQEELIEKQKESARGKILFKFWTEFLDTMKNKSELFSTISPSTGNWILKGAGKQGLSYIISANKNKATVYLDFNFQASGVLPEDKKKKNKQRYDQISKFKSEIEDNFGDKLEWNRNEDTQFSAIGYTLDEGYDSEDWQTLHLKLIDAMLRLEKVMSKYVKKLD